MAVKKLYAISELSFAARHYDGTFRIVAIDVLKETTQLYYVKRAENSSGRKVIRKDDPYIYSTLVDAVKNYRKILKYVLSTACRRVMKAQEALDAFDEQIIGANVDHLSLDEFNKVLAEKLKPENLRE